MYEYYVFYFYGFIVEGKNFKFVYKIFGVYDFIVVKEVFVDDSYYLIVYYRLKGIELFVFVKKFVVDVEVLISVGVDELNISLVGFLRGGVLLILVVNEFKCIYINLVILVGCVGLIKKNLLVKVYGKVYFIFECLD